MTKPFSRNYIAWGSFSPRVCNYGVLPCEDTPNGLSSGRNQAPASVCSGAYKAGEYDYGGRMWRVSDAYTGSAEYTVGGTMEFEFAAPGNPYGMSTTWHDGRIQIQLCVADSGDTCTSTYVLQPVDKTVANGCPSGGDCSWWYPGGAAGSAPARPSVVLQLPAGVTCDGVAARCIVLMRYQAANDGCNPNLPVAFASEFAPYGAACTATSEHTWEQFWNCADVKILAKDGSTPPVAASPVPVLPSPPAAAPELPSPTPAQPSPQKAASPSPAAAVPELPSPAPVAPSPTPAASPVDATDAPPASPSSTNVCADKPDGRTPGPDCKGFYNCDGGHGGYLACPGDLLFDTATDGCNYDYLVNKATCSSASLGRKMLQLPAW